MCKWWLAIIALSLSLPVLAETSTACAAPEYNRLNFWLGDWDTYEADGKGPSEARNHVTSILDGCAILERYEGTDGHIGESLTVYDASRNVWHQTWVTNQGHLLVLEGRFNGFVLTLEGSEMSDDHKPELIRGTWLPQLDGVRETAYISKDGGKTWGLDFDILFKSHHGK